MLGKLLKYDLKSISYILIPMHGFLLLISLIGRILFLIGDNLPVAELFVGLFMIFYVFYIMASAVITFVLLVYSFYKSMYSSEGYLTHTLPVTVNQHMISKLISTTIWTIVNAICICLALIIISFDWTNIIDFINMTFELNAMLIERQGIHLLLGLIPCIIMYALVYPSTIHVPIYLCSAIGQTANKNKLAFSFLAYVAYSIIKDIGLSIIMAILVSFSHLDFLNELSLSGYTQFLIIAYSVLAVRLATTAIMYYITCRITETKLNLA